MVHSCCLILPIHVKRSQAGVWIVFGACGRTLGNEGWVRRCCGVIYCAEESEPQRIALQERHSQNRRLNPPGACALVRRDDRGVLVPDLDFLALRDHQNIRVHQRARFARACSRLYMRPIASTSDTSSPANSCIVKIKLHTVSAEYSNRKMEDAQVNQKYIFVVCTTQDFGVLCIDAVLQVGGELRSGAPSVKPQNCVI